MDCALGLVDVEDPVALGAEVTVDVRDGDVAARRLNDEVQTRKLISRRWDRAARSQTFANADVSAL